MGYELYQIKKYQHELIQISEDVLHKISTAVWYAIYNKIKGIKLQKNKTKYHENKTARYYNSIYHDCIMNYIK